MMTFVHLLIRDIEYSSICMCVMKSLTKFLESHPLKSQIPIVEGNICVQREREREAGGGGERDGGGGEGGERDCSYMTGAVLKKALGVLESCT